MDAMDIESKLSDVTVTAIPLVKSRDRDRDRESSSSSANTAGLQQQLQQQILLQQQQQALQMQLNALNASSASYSNSNSNGNGGYPMSLPTAPGMSKYGHLLAVIEEMGRDIRPTYSGSRTSAERLKRGIVHARILVRECLLETERSARN